MSSLTSLLPRSTTVVHLELGKGYSVGPILRICVLNPYTKGRVFRQSSTCQKRQAITTLHDLEFPNLSQRTNTKQRRNLNRRMRKKERKEERKILIKGRTRKKRKERKVQPNVRLHSTDKIEFTTFARFIRNVILK